MLGLPDAMLVGLSPKARSLSFQNMRYKNMTIFLTWSPKNETVSMNGLISLIKNTILWGPSYRMSFRTTTVKTIREQPKAVGSFPKH